MLFYDEKEEKDKIISKFTIEDEKIKVEYLYDEKVEYYDISEKSNIIKKMLEQAISRDKDLYLYYKKWAYKNLFLNILTDITIISAISHKAIFLLCVLFIIKFNVIKQTFNDYCSYLDLKKYHEYLSIEKDINSFKYHYILNIFQDYYDTKLDINTLDEFLPHQIKELKKVLDNEKSF